MNTIQRWMVLNALTLERLNRAQAFNDWNALNDWNQWNVWNDWNRGGDGAAPTEDREERSVRLGVEPGMALPVCAYARKPPDRLFVFQCSTGKGVPTRHRFP